MMQHNSFMMNQQHSQMQENQMQRQSEYAAPDAQVLQPIRQMLQPVQEGGGTIQEMMKELQKNDPDAKLQWAAYCNKHGDGTRDPMKHNAEYIQTFLHSYQNGQRLPLESDGIPIADVTKLLQKRSLDFRSVWEEYCKISGHGKKDPLAYDADFHIGFYSWMAQKARIGCGGAPRMGGLVGGGMMGGGMMYEPPLKRMRDNHNMGFGTGGSGDPTKDRMVLAIKAYQKAGEQQKQTWWTFCDSQLGGNRDPARHDTETLLQFIERYGVSEPSASPTGMTGGLSPRGPTQQNSQLIATIKTFQKAGEQQKQLWWSFCDSQQGGNRDPARHEPAVLLQFIEAYGLEPAELPVMSMTGGMMMKPAATQSFSMGSQDPAHEQLVATIKAFQKSGEQQKQTWWAFCDTQGKNRDPARYDSGILQQFIEDHGLELVPGGMVVGMGGGMGNMAMHGRVGMAIGGGMAVSPLDPMKLELVERVKAFQKTGEQQKMAWYSFCGNIKDPAKHEPSKLQEFIECFCA